MLAKPVPRSAELALGSAGSVEYIFYIFLIIFGVVIIASIVLGATLQPKIFDSIVGNVGTSVTGIGTSIQKGIGNVITAFIDRIISSITSAIDKVVSPITSGAQAAGGFLSSEFQKLFNWLKGL